MFQPAFFSLKSTESGYSSTSLEAAANESRRGLPCALAPKIEATAINETITILFMSAKLAQIFLMPLCAPNLLGIFKANRFVLPFS